MKNKFYLIIFLSLIVKVVFAYFTPIIADEAYYYIWSLKPQLSYFDHPSMVSWFIYIGRLIAPENSNLALRGIFILASTLTVLIWIKTLRKLSFSEKNILFFLILYLLNPLLGLGSIVATPDVPLVLFWSMSYLAFVSIFEDGISHRKKLFWYSFLGFSLGLGFCSKYHIVLFVLSGFISLILKNTYKKISIVGICATLLFGIIFSSPVIVWNYQNEWASFTYQLKHGFGKTYYDISWTITFILGQAAIMNPLVFVKLFNKKNFSTDQVFSGSQLLFFLSSSFKAVVEANWPITAHMHATTHATKNLSSRRFKYALYYWLTIYLLLVIVLLSPLKKNILKNQYTTLQTNELIKIVNKYSPLYGSSYQISSLLSWQTQTFIPKLNGLSRFDFFDTLPESNPSEKTIFVLKHFDSIWPEKYSHYVKTKIETFDNLGIELYQFKCE